MNFLLLLVLWLIISIPLGVLVGEIIKDGMGGIWE